MFLINQERLEVQINHWTLQCEIIGDFHKNTFDGMVKTNWLHWIWERVKEKNEEGEELLERGEVQW